MSDDIYIDLNYLTESERDAILQVLAKDDELRRQEKKRLSQLKTELDTIKFSGLEAHQLSSDARVCGRCKEEFGIVFNTGDFCPKCKVRVCKKCREPLNESWVCLLCAKVREVKAKSGAWFFENEKKKIRKPALYGSVLLRASLKRAKKAAKAEQKPVIIEPPPPPIINLNLNEHSKLHRPVPVHMSPLREQDGADSDEKNNDAHIEHPEYEVNRNYKTYSKAVHVTKTQIRRVSEEEDERRSDSSASSSPGPVEGDADQTLIRTHGSETSEDRPIFDYLQEHQEERPVFDYLKEDQDASRSSQGSESYSDSKYDGQMDGLEGYTRTAVNSHVVRDDDYDYEDTSRDYGDEYTGRSGYEVREDDENYRYSYQSSETGTDHDAEDQSSRSQDSLQGAVSMDTMTSGEFITPRESPGHSDANTPVHSSPEPDSERDSLVGAVSMDTMTSGEFITPRETPGHSDANTSGHSDANTPVHSSPEPDSERDSLVGAVSMDTQTSGEFITPRETPGHPDANTPVHSSPEPDSERDMVGAVSMDTMTSGEFITPRETPGHSDANTPVHSSPEPDSERDMVGAVSMDTMTSGEFITPRETPGHSDANTPVHSSPEPDSERDSLVGAVSMDTQTSGEFITPRETPGHSDANTPVQSSPEPDSERDIVGAVSMDTMTSGEFITPRETPGHSDANTPVQSSPEPDSERDSLQGAVSMDTQTSGEFITPRETPGHSDANTPVHSSPQPDSERDWGEARETTPVIMDHDDETEDPRLQPYDVVPPAIITTTVSDDETDEADGVQRSVGQEEGEDIDQAFAEYGVDPTRDRLTRQFQDMGSRESIVSYYSDAGEGNYGNIEVTGEVQLGLLYDFKRENLEVQIHRARDIAAADAKKKRSDPYIKVYLLPDKTKGGKRKTKTKKHTLNPSFDEILAFKVGFDEMLTRTMWLTVWNHDRFGHNDFLGEVMLPLGQYEESGFSWSDPSEQWYPLRERRPEPSLMKYCGEIVVSLKYVPAQSIKSKKKKKKGEEKGELHVVVKEGRNLPAKDANGFSDPFCKAYLLPDKGKKSKRKTPTIKKNLNPVWNFPLEYDDITLEELMDRALELTVWDWDRGASNDFLGGVRLGMGTKMEPWDDAEGQEITAWQAMLDFPNEWHDFTIGLRSSMDSRA